MHNEPGWTGLLTRNQYPGAYPNGTRIIKTWGELGDAHPLGALGTVLGSIGAPQAGIGYFIEWDAQPQHAFLVAARKVSLHKPN